MSSWGILLPLVSFCLFLNGCGKAETLHDFRFLGDAIVRAANWAWSSNSRISSGNNVNDDRDFDGSGVCVSTGGTGLVTGGPGCMQQASIAFLDSKQWLVSYPQVNSGNLYYFGIFSNLSTISTGIFSTPAAIDPGNIKSARYVKYGKLKNGDVIAIYWLENAGSTAREVYATVFNGTTLTWGTAVRLSSAGFNTDFGSDGLDSGNNYAILCRPDIAVGGDGSALISWCEEDTGAAPDVRVKYRFYNGGNWIPAIGSNPTALSTSTDLFFPGFQANAANLKRYDNGGWVDFYTSNPTEIDNVLSIVGSDISIAADVGTGAATCTHTVTVSGVEDSPGTDEFDVVRDSNGNVLECTTFRNLIQSMLQSPSVTGCSVGSKSLSQLGISGVLDPNCSDSDVTTWNITFYYNRSLNNILRSTTNTAYDYVYLNQLKINTFNFDGNPADATREFENLTATYNFDWLKSAGVAIAGDQYGNYAMVRNVVSPYFKNSGVAFTDIDRARILVGHEYVQNVGWRTVPNTTVTTKLLTQKVSAPSGCLGATDYSSCSSRNPKFMMSEGGKGLVLYYRNQSTPYTGSSFRNRLWYTVYSTTNGFSSTSAILDEDTYCTAGYNANDVPVCETGSYSDSCQTLPESLNLTTGLGLDFSAASASTLSSDIPPIASEMNSQGTAVVAYHKKANTGTYSAPNCTYYGTYARIYDPVNSFSQTYRLDSGLGDSMHVKVSINTNGQAVAIWEEKRGTTVYVFIKKYSGGTWSAAEEVAVSNTTDTDPMWPSARINDKGEIFVTYSVGKYTSKSSDTRHQYGKIYAIY